MGVSSSVAPLLAHSGARSALAATGAAGIMAPDAGTAQQTRGAGDELRMLLAQAPTGASPHVARATADYWAAAPVLEPLMHMLPNGTLIPNLIDAVPTLDNGLLAKDFGSATFRFPKDLTWSDGEPVSAADLVFTWQWILNPNNQASSFAVWNAIASAEATGTHTAVVTFKQPAANWFAPFTGNYNGSLYPAHLFDNDPANRNDAFLTSPVGTGPYVITGFSPAGEVSYEINERYRDPTKPHFGSLSLVASDDPSTAARSVIETGESDVAWGMLLDPATFKDLTGAGGSGTLYSSPESSIESMRFNFSDPRTEVNGEKSQKDTPHPIFSDRAVRQALSLAVNRGQIAAKIYGTGEHPTANVLVGMPAYTSSATGWEYDLEKANRILDKAGWELDGATRSKDGVALAFDFCASTNAIRQEIQRLVQADFAKVGATVDLKQVDPAAFFGITADADQSFYHMLWDLGMWTDGTFESYPLAFMRRWYAGEDGENIAQQSNDWLGEREAYQGIIANTQRYINPDYDTLYETLEQTLDMDEACQLLIQMNDLLVTDVVEIPIVVRAESYALANRVRRENVVPGPFVIPLWNIANWNEIDDLLK